MDHDMKRKIVYGILSLVLTTLAAKLADYLTTRILGEPKD